MAGVPKPQGDMRHSTPLTFVQMSEEKAPGQLQLQ